MKATRQKQTKTRKISTSRASVSRREWEKGFAAGYEAGVTSMRRVADIALRNARNEYESRKMELEERNEGLLGTIRTLKERPVCCDCGGRIESRSGRTESPHVVRPAEFASSTKL
jgi:hypothetical protein